jgi:hypothetical protein
MLLGNTINLENPMELDISSTKYEMEPYLAEIVKHSPSEGRQVSGVDRGHNIPSHQWLDRYVREL